MGRRPIDLRMKNGRTPLQALWEELRKQREEFTIASLAKATHQKTNTVGEYVRRWLRGGFVEVIREVKDGRSYFNVYRLTRDNGVEAPRLNRDGSPMTSGRINESMWMAMRILREFTPTELAAHASVSQPVTYNTASKYCRFLEMAGYLRATLVPVRQGQSKRYLLLPAKNTGPRPPVIQITHNVYDANLGKVVWTSPVAGEEAGHDE